MDFDKFAKRFNIKHPQYVDKMTKLFSQYYPQEENLSKAQKNTLEEMLANAKEIHKILSPLEKLGLYFSLSVVGGAVREFTMDRTELINDYDFVINLKHNNFIDSILDEQRVPELFGKKEAYKFKSELAEFKEYRDSLRDPKSTDFFSHSTLKREEKDNMNIFFCQKLIEKQIKESQKHYSLFKNKDVENKYLNKHINAIFQMQGLDGKKIDIILSEYNGLGFMTTFDFEICKCAIDLEVVNEEEKYKGKEKSEILNNLWLTPGMLKDIDEKTLTINVDNFNTDHIHYFMNKHFLKLRKKFPEYELNYFAKRGLDKTEEIQTLQFYKVKEKHDILQEDLLINNKNKGIKLKI